MGIEIAVSIIGALVALSATVGISVKIAQNMMQEAFAQLQSRIITLREDVEAREKEIITLRKMIDDRDGRYQKLFEEHSKVKVECEILRIEVKALREHRA